MHKNYEVDKALVRHLKTSKLLLKASAMNEFEKLATNSVYLWQRYHWK